MIPGSHYFDGIRRGSHFFPLNRWVVVNLSSLRLGQNKGCCIESGWRNDRNFILMYRNIGGNVLPMESIGICFLPWQPSEVISFPWECQSGVLFFSREPMYVIFFPWSVFGLYSSSDPHAATCGLMIHYPFFPIGYLSLVIVDNWWGFFYDHNITYSTTMDIKEAFIINGNHV